MVLFGGEKMITLKSTEHYNNILQKYKKQTREFYDKAFRPHDVIGKCMNAYRTWIKTTNDTTLESFFNYYLANVKSEDTFVSLSNVLSYLTNLPKEDMLDLLVRHVIIETYFGGQVENYVIDYIKKQKGTEIVNLDKETKELFDRKYGVDIVFTFEGKTYFVQVKPVSFFLGKAETTITDRINALNEVRLLKEKYPQYKDAILKFCVYDSERQGFLTIRNSIFVDLDKKYFDRDTKMFWYDFCRNNKENFNFVMGTTEKKLNYYDGDIVPEDDTIFVFGSNPEGRHGAGSARVAVKQFGAIYGKGEGLQGNSYALPTTELRYNYPKMTLANITKNIQKLYDCARRHPDKKFKIAYRNKPDEVTLCGYSGKQLQECFKNAGEIPENIWFSKEWIISGNLA